METVDNLLSYRKSRFDIVINNDIFYFKTNQSKKFYNWLINKCIILNIDIIELFPGIKCLKFSICNIRIVIDIKYINIYMLKVISNIITSNYDYKIAIKELHNGFTVNIIPCYQNDKYDINIKNIDDIYIYIKQKNISIKTDIIPLFFVIEAK